MSVDLLFDMADKACVRAWEDEGWGPIHKKLLTTCLKLENSGWGGSAKAKRKEKNMTQTQHVINHLKKHANISPREALLDYNISRLAAHIHVLRTDYNMKIRTVRKRNPVTGLPYARYEVVANA